MKDSERLDFMTAVVGVIGGEVCFQDIIDRISDEIEKAKTYLEVNTTDAKRCPLYVDYRKSCQALKDHEYEKKTGKSARS